MPMKLLLDIGNTFAKIAFMDNYKVVSLYRFADFSIAELTKIISEHTDVDGAVLTSVRHRDETLISFLSERFERFIEIRHDTQMPVKIEYDTPKTLGMDRVMACVGARHFESNKKLLVVDLGSAVTFDVVSADGVFSGGNISPGVNLRFRSLNLFTKKLPLCNLTEKISLYGRDTDSAVVNGVVNGMIFEIEGYIRRLERENGGFSIFFTGGDANYFADKLKKTIFVESNLALIGMYEVFKYNYERE